MRFLLTRELPPPREYASLLAQTFGAAAVASANTLYGTGFRVTVAPSGVPVTLALKRAQGRRHPVAITLVEAPVATRGVDIELSPARSMPSSMSPRSVPHPALASLACVAAPDVVVARVLDSATLDALAQLKGSDDDPGELRIESGRVELSFTGWPPDAATLHALASLTARLATALPPAIDAVAGPGATVDAHPEVVALRERRAARKRLGRSILAATLVVFVLVPIAVAAISLASR